MVDRTVLGDSVKRETVGSFVKGSRCAICGERAEILIDSDDCLRVDHGEYVCGICCNECPFGPSICLFKK